MEITDVRVRRIYQGRDPVRATVSIVIDDVFAIHDIKVIYKDGKIFASMPSQKSPDGYRDICHPLDTETREMIERRILRAYFEDIECHELKDCPFETKERYDEECTSAINRLVTLLLSREEGEDFAALSRRRGGIFPEDDNREGHES